MSKALSTLQCAGPSPGALSFSRREVGRLFAAIAAGAWMAPVAAAEPPLDALARAKGLRFGSTLGVGGTPRRASGFNDPAYRALTARECSVLVLENEAK